MEIILLLLSWQLVQQAHSFHRKVTAMGESMFDVVEFIVLLRMFKSYFKIWENFFNFTYIAILVIADDTKSYVDFGTQNV